MTSSHLETEWGKANRVLVSQQLAPYLEKISRKGSESTSQTYLTAFTGLCKSTEKLPDQIISELKEGRTDTYSFLDNYVKYMVRDARVSPTTVGCYVAGVKRILRFAGVKIDNFEFNDKVVVPPGYTQTKDRIPTKEELRRMLGVTDSRGRTMISTLVSSGMRIGEVLSAQMKDVQFGHPTRILIRAENTKNKMERIAFVSDEASGFLKDYLGRRIEVPESYLFLDLGCAKPLAYEAVHYLFQNILEKSGLTERDAGRMVIHIHVLRKYFFSHIPPILGRDVTEALMGHEEYLDASYLRWTGDQMAEFRRSACYHG